MNYPGEYTMRVLEAFATAVGAVCTVEGEFLVVLPDGTEFDVGDGDAVDDLVGRGWLESEGDVIRVTESGRYWLGRWCGGRKPPRVGVRGVVWRRRASGGVA